jgi:hypothetical protein
VQIQRNSAAGARCEMSTTRARVHNAQRCAHAQRHTAAAPPPPGQPPAVANSPIRNSLAASRCACGPRNQKQIVLHNKRNAKHRGPGRAGQAPPARTHRAAARAPRQVRGGRLADRAHRVHLGPFPPIAAILLLCDAGHAPRRLPSRQQSNSRQRVRAAELSPSGDSADQQQQQEDQQQPYQQDYKPFPRRGDSNPYRYAAHPSPCFTRSPARCAFVVPAFLASCRIGGACGAGRQLAPTALAPTS